MYQTWFKKDLIKLPILLLFSGLFTYIFVFGCPDLVTLNSTLLNGLGDELLVLWIFKQVCHNIIYNPANLFYGGILFPNQATLAFAEGMWIPSLFFGMFRVLFKNEFFSLYATILSFFVLDFITMYLFVRKIKGEMAGIVSGFVFAFSMVRVAQVVHIQLLPQFFFPLVALCIYDYEQDGKIKYLLWASLLAVCQFYSSVNLGMILFVSLIPYVGVRLKLKPEKKKFLRDLSVFSGLSALLLAPLVCKYISVSQAHHIIRSISETHIYGIHITHLLAADPGSFWGPITDKILIAKGQMQEKHLFVGLVVLFLALLGYRKEKFWFWVLFFSFAFVVWMAHGPAARLYTVFYYLVPGFKGIRVPARFGFSYLFFISLFAGLGANELIQIKVKKPTLVLLVISLFVFFIVENHITIPKYPIPKDLVEVSQKIKELGNQDPVVHFPLDTLDTVRMYYSQKHGHPIFNGYSGFIPEPQLSLLLSERQDGATIQTLEKLRTIGIKLAVVEQPSPQWLKFLKKNSTLLWENQHTALFKL